MRSRLLLPVAALALVGVTGFGARGSIGLFLAPWEEQFGVSRGSVALVGTVGFVVLALGQPVAGRLLESFDPRRLLVLGALLAAAGYAGAAFAGSLWAAVLGIGVVAALGAALGSLATLSYIALELPLKRPGAVLGILAAAAAGGQAVVLPLAAAALDASLRTALLVLAGLLAGAAAAVFAFVPAAPPAAHAERVPLRLADLARSRPFWLLALPYFICGYTTTGMMDTHLIPYAADHHITATAASGAVATLAAFNVAGVLLSGWLVDRVHRPRLLACLYGMRALTLVFLPFAGSVPSLVVFAIVFGIVDFATVPPTAALARDYFARGGFGFALGLIGAAHQLGSALGAWLPGVVHDATGGYDPAFVSAAVLAVVASALSLGLGERRPVLPRGEPEPAAA